MVLNAQRSCPLGMFPVPVMSFELTRIYELSLVALQAGEALGVEYERPPARELLPSQVEQRCPAVAVGEDLPGDRRRPGNNFVGKLAKFLGVHDPALGRGRYRGSVAV